MTIADRAGTRQITFVTPYRIDNAFVRDPNGYLIEIQRFWEPLV